MVDTKGRIRLKSWWRFWPFNAMDYQTKMLSLCVTGQTIVTFCSFNFQFKHNCAEPNGFRSTWDISLFDRKNIISTHLLSLLLTLVQKIVFYIFYICIFLFRIFLLHRDSSVSAKSRWWNMKLSQNKNQFICFKMYSNKTRADLNQKNCIE